MAIFESSCSIVISCILLGMTWRRSVPIIVLVVCCLLRASVIIHVAVMTTVRLLSFSGSFCMLSRTASEIRGYARPHNLSNSLLCSNQELLLLTNDHARSADAHPGDEWLSLESKLVHNIEADKSASSAETCSAVNSNSLPFFRVTFGKCNEFPNDTIFRAGSIRELHLMNFDLTAFKVLLIV